MVALPNHDPITEAEYLALEREAQVKHEFIDGEIIAMVGGSEPHHTITGNIFASFHGQLRKRPCRVYQSEMRVRVSETGTYTYPDVTAICGDAVFMEDEPIATLLNPTVLVEVLSPSTASYDQTTKLDHYIQLPSLQDYLIVSQDRAWVVRYTRQETGWLRTVTEGLDATVDLPSIGCTLPMGEVYAKVAFESEKEQNR